uniref:Uncharacterized protein n=1 Tax=Cannabis sativa TaxID=3483 RepID=A0A803P7X8_CANSA
MISEKKTANAMAGKTARACDSCLRKRARWFCAADDAFLCQSCDASVHSANQLASRHERVRLQTSSFKGISKISGEVNDSSSPAWLRGFTRKARTPRSNNKGKKKDEEDMWRADTGHNNSGNLMIRGGGRRSNNEVGGGREARVSRYREKRRTRLFAKKIRYEVRKLNAEKRPRMKGRFVKRSSFMTNNNQLMMSTK